VAIPPPEVLTEALVLWMRPQLAGEEAVRAIAGGTAAAAAGGCSPTENPRTSRGLAGATLVKPRGL